MRGRVTGLRLYEGYRLIQEVPIPFIGERSFRECLNARREEGMVYLNKLYGLSHRAELCSPGRTNEYYGGLPYQLAGVLPQTKLKDLLARPHSPQMVIQHHNFTGDLHSKVFTSYT